MDRAHALSSGIERKLAQAGRPSKLSLQVDAGLLRDDAEARLSRIAQNGVAVIFFIRRDNARIAAKRRRRQQHFQVRVIRRRDFFLSGEHLSFRCVAKAGHVEFLPRQPRMGDRHFILRQRSGLIRADDRGAAERFHCGKPLHERVFFCHALHSHGERERNGRQQAFRNKRDDHAEGENERLREGLLHKGDGSHKKRQTNGNGDDRNLLRQNVEFLLQRTLLFLCRLRQLGDAAELGLHADLGDDGPRGAARHARSLKDQVRDLKTGNVFLQHRVVTLAHGVRFAVQRRLVDLQVAAGNQPRIGGNLVALLNEHDVARHKVFGQNLYLVAVTHDARIRWQHFLQGFARLAGSEFLNKTENAVDDVDEPDGDAELRHLRNKRHNAADPEQDCHETDEIGEKHEDDRFPFLLLDHVFAVFLLVFLNLLRRQAGGACSHQLADFILREFVNAFYIFVHPG